MDGWLDRCTVCRNKWMGRCIVSTDTWIMGWYGDYMGVGIDR